MYNKNSNEKLGIINCNRDVVVLLSSLLFMIADSVGSNRIALIITGIMKYIDSFRNVIRKFLILNLLFFK